LEEKISNALEKNGWSPTVEKTYRVTVTTVL